MSIFSSNTTHAQTIKLTDTDVTKGQKFLTIDDSKLSSGLPKDDKYVASFVFTGNTGAYIKASFIGNLDRSGTQTLPVVSESNYEGATYEVLNDSVEVEHLYNLDSEELQMFSTRTANATHTTIELELRNLNDQTFYFTAYFEGYTYDVPLESLTTSSSNFLFGDRGVFGGGNDGAEVNTIDYITIATPGNATNFGDLTQNRSQLSATSDGSRGVFGGGLESGAATTYHNTIDYIPISTTGNATDFGDLIEGRSGLAATSDGSRGVFGGGYYSGAMGGTLGNTIDYITISTTGNATDFGDLTWARDGLAATSDGSRGVFGGGSDTGAGSVVNIIDYITISTPGNATDFGDLIQNREGLAATSDGSRGVFGGGQESGAATSYYNTIEYIPISTPGNATDFGNLTQTRGYLGATSDGSRGVFGGGRYPSYANTIDYIPISTPGNATDFGDLTEARNGLAATSGD